MTTVYVPSIYFASTEQLQRRGLELPDGNLSLEEQQARAASVLANLEDSRPKPTGLIEGLVNLLVPQREDPEQRAFRLLVELITKYGAAVFHRGGRGAGCGPLADCATQIVRQVFEPVAAAGGREAMARVFGKLEDHCKRSYGWPEHRFIMSSLDWAATDANLGCGWQA